MYLKLSLALIGLFFSTGSLSAQEIPAKYGDVPMEDLKMKVYAEDTGASAVMLCNYDSIKFVIYEDKPAIEYDRLVRIKILKKSGLSFGDAVIQYFGRGAEVVSGLHAETFNLDEKGNIQKEEIASNAIFDESVIGGFHMKKFTLPGLKEGSVIEYTYKIFSYAITFFHPFSFQQTIPVRWSECRIKIPDFYTYYVVFKGIQQADMKDEKPFKDEYTINHDTKFYLHGTEKRYAMKNVPAFEEEPYITSMNDYTIRMIINISSVDFPAMFSARLTKNWDELVKDINEDDGVGRPLNHSKDVQKQGAEITKGISSPKDKMIAVYNYVKKNLKWDDGNYAVSIDNDPKITLKNGAGTSAEINMVLGAMLKGAGLDVHEVLISTRDNGAIIQEDPSLSQFNNLIIFCKTDKEEYLLDATDPNRPYNLLSEQDLNGTGLMIDEDHPGWIDLISQQKTKKSTNAMLTIDGDGTVSGKVQSSKDGFFALKIRKVLMKAEKKDYIKDFFGPFADDIKVDNFSIKNLDTSEATLMFDYNISTSHFSNAAGDFIYLQPMLLYAQTENIFKKEKRKYPVGFSHTSDETFTLVLTIPDGYEVKEYPKNVSITIDSTNTNFRYVINVDGNKIQLLAKIKIDREIFPVARYKQLRDFYTSIVAKEAEQIVFKKKS